MHTHERRWSAMGTVFEAFLVGEDDEHLEAVAAAVEEEIRRVEARLSRFDPASEVTRINRDAAQRSVRLDAELGHLLAACERYSTRTHGAFDITAGSEGSYVLGIDPPSIRFTHAATRIDLGGIGKGFALDRAADLLKRFSITRGLLNAGTSSVLAIGPGSWPVDLRDPAGDGRPHVGRIHLEARALSCSAARRQDQFASDLLDPASGVAISGEAGCAVLAGTAEEAEVLSTALLVMGREPAARYLEQERWPGVHAAWIEHSQLDWLTEPP